MIEWFMEDFLPVIFAMAFVVMFIYTIRELFLRVNMKILFLVLTLSGCSILGLVDEEIKDCVDCRRELRDTRKRLYACLSSKECSEKKRAT